MRWTLTASLVLFSIFCCANGQSSTPEPPKKVDYYYNATTSLLRLTRGLPMKVSVHAVNTGKLENGTNTYSFGALLASADFPEPTKVRKLPLSGLSKMVWMSFIYSPNGHRTVTLSHYQDNLPDQNVQLAQFSERLNHSNTYNASEQRSLETDALKC